MSGTVEVVSYDHQDSRFLSFWEENLGFGSSSPESEPRISFLVFVSVTVYFYHCWQSFSSENANHLDLEKGNL